MIILKFFIACTFIFISYLQGSNCINIFESNSYKAKYSANFSKLDYVIDNPNQKGEINIGLIGSVNNLHPLGLLGSLPKEYFNLSFDSLFFAPLDDINNFYPLLGEKICIEGNKVFIYLNKDAYWSNNQPITSEDVKFTIDLAKNSSLAYYRSVLASLTKVDTKDGLVIFNFINNPETETIITIISLPILNKEFWENKDLKRFYQELPIVTSGAYLLVNFNPKKGEVYFAKNMNYWAKNLNIRKGFFNFDKINFYYYSQPVSLYKNVKRGKINFVFANDLDYKLFSEDLLLKMQKINRIPDFHAVFFNTKSNYLNNVKFRKAITYAFNFSFINQSFFNNQSIRLNSLFLNTEYAVKNDLLEFNLLKADVLLQDLGYFLKDKVRVDEQGNQITLKLLLQNSKHKKFYLDFQDNLTRLGIKLDLVIVSKQEYNFLKNNKSYDLLDANYLFANPPSKELKSYFSADTRFNYSNINNPYLNKLIMNALNSSNKKDFQILDQYIFDNYFFIPLNYQEYDRYFYKDIFVWNESNVRLDISAMSIK